MNRKLCTVFTYVPESHVESLLDAVFDAGAGAIGDYSRCAWRTKGMGQFMPGKASRPFIGARDELNTVEEIRIEFVCPKERLSKVLSALVSAHPYEEPAHGAIRIITRKNHKK